MRSLSTQKALAYVAPPQTPMGGGGGGGGGGEGRGAGDPPLLAAALSYATDAGHKLGAHSYQTEICTNGAL